MQNNTKALKEENENDLNFTAPAAATMAHALPFRRDAQVSSGI